MSTRRTRLTRIFEYLITIWVILTLNFLLPRLMPGDPFLYLGADEGQDIAAFSQKQRAYYREYYGLDRPLSEQYLAYLGALCRADLGTSLYYGGSVGSIIAKRLPWTLFLVLSATLFSALGGLVLGGISAMRRDSVLDKLLFTASVMLSSIPSFLVGLVLLFLFAAGLRWFPLSGGVTAFTGSQPLLYRLTDLGKHATLPIAALTVVRTAQMTLLARNSTITILAQAYMQTARAKGLKPARILVQHALRNAFPPVFTRVFLSLGSLVGGAILVENIFAYPGLGRLMREAVTVHDYPMLQGIFLVVTFFVLGANWLADLLYPKLDPRLTGNGKQA